MRSEDAKNEKEDLSEPLRDPHLKEFETPQP